MTDSPFAGRDWKSCPLTADEARLLWRRDAEQRSLDWQSFRVHWPMHAFEFLREFLGGLLLGAALSLSIGLWVLAELLRVY